jgi:hypothetical protein
MRGTQLPVCVPVAVFVLAASLQPAHAQSRDSRDPGAESRRPVVHEEHDYVTNATFAAMPDGQGNAKVTVRVDDFAVEKILAPNGDSTIRLSQGKDTVSIALNNGGYSVQRAGRTAHFDPQAPTVGDLDAVREVLLGSSAVRVFRRLTASLEDRDDEATGPLMLSALVDGSIVEMLDGDSAAPARIGRRITRKARASMQPARFVTGSNTFEDCVLKYELSLVYAWDLLQACVEAAWNSKWYIWLVAEPLCEVEFFLRSQEYIYQFISCFAYPF